MEDVMLPGWLIYLVSPILGGWLLWLTMMAFENKQSNAINSTMAHSVNNELLKLNEAIDKLDTKLNTFLSKELEFLKMNFKRE